MHILLVVIMFSSNSRIFTAIINCIAHYFGDGSAAWKICHLRRTANASHCKYYSKLPLLQLSIIL